MREINEYIVKYFQRMHLSFIANNNIRVEYASVMPWLGLQNLQLAWVTCIKAEGNI